ncbi:hypothetical protein J1N35_019044 [Gossypium stocksii]|uniref:Uncharacterized protein n=1 Tax=Gossypium stocksii TaxID=47602 RepID=A0A9D3VR89_9ROSI|nr:hypothetical protein J1N35_019044 [Gossypium stocksii]
MYGFLGSRKWALMHSFNNIQRAIEHSPSSFLNQKELEVRDELENILDHKDLLWTQKARYDGGWCSDQVFLQAKVVEFFERLYGKNPSPPTSMPNFDYPSLNHMKVSFPEVDVTNEEIKMAIFDMDPLKVPGSDGFHALFFQS